MKYRILMLLAVVSLVGCFAKVSGYIIPGEILDRNGLYYIIFDKSDERAVHELLVNGFAKQGINATSGFADRVPAEAAYVVRYAAEWTWDITWYLNGLEITVYETPDDLMVASASSSRSSLVRKDTEKTADEVLGKLFGELPTQEY